MSRPGSLVSIIVPSYNEQDNVGVLFKQVQKYLKDWQFEIIYVDDGSSDATLDNIRSLAAEHKQVKYLSFSRNFGHQAALRAGLQYAAGDAVISMDADLQHPPRLLPQLLDKWQAGYQVVYTIRKDTSDTTRFKRVTSKRFYRLVNYLSDLHIEEGAADFRLLDKKVVEIIRAQQEINLFLRGYINWLGFKQFAIPYTPARRHSGSSKYTIKKMMDLALNGITQFSVKPLRLSILVGAGFAVLGALYGLYALVRYFVGPHAVTSGWTSLVVIVLIIGGIQLVLLGIVGEYVGKIFLQAKGRPDFLVGETNIE